MFVLTRVLLIVGLLHLALSGRINHNPGSNSSCPTGPVSPTMNSTGGTNSTRPVNSTNSTNSTNPTNPMNVTNSTNPTNSDNSTNSTNPINSTNSTNSTNPTDPTSPINSTNSTGSTNPNNGTNSTNPTNPTNSSNSTNSTTASDCPSSTILSGPLCPTNSSAIAPNGVFYDTLSDALDAYECSDDYHYVTLADANRTLSEYYNQGPHHNGYNDPDEGGYRLQSGAEVDLGIGTYYKDSDPYIYADYALCRQTSFTSITLETAARCSDDFDVMSLEEATQNLQSACDALGPNTDAARVGIYSVVKRGDAVLSTCSIVQWDPTPLDNVLCVQRNTLQQQFSPINQLQCPQGDSYSGQSLITVKEALTNLDGYCSLVPAGSFARLSGGASIGKNGCCQCVVLAEDTRPLTNGLCADADRYNIGSYYVKPNYVP